MKIRKGIAEDLKKILFSDEVSELDKKRKNQAISIFNIIKSYYNVYDLDNNTNHSKIFECLYMSKKYLSDVTVAQKTFVSVDTLRKYIAKYNRLTSLLIKKLNIKL